MKHVIPLVPVAVIVVLLGPVGPAAAAEDPRFVTTVTEPTVDPGETQTVSVHLENDAEDVDDQVETVYNVRATLLEDDLPFEVRSGTQFVGTLADGDPTPTTFTVVAPGHLDPGTYRLPIDLSYEHDDEAKSATVYATVHVPSEPYFSVDPVDVEVQSGTTETTTFEVTNVGSENATDTSVTFRASPSVTIADGEARSSLGKMAPNESRTISFETTVATTASPGSHAIEAKFEYRDANGNEEEPLTLTGSIPVTERNDFDLSFDTTVQPGSTEAVAVTVTNLGPKPTRNVDLVLRNSGSIQIADGESREFLGDMAPNESQTLMVEATVGTAVTAGEKRIDAVVDYDGPNGVDAEPLRVTGSLPVIEQNDFSISVDTPVQPGSTEDVAVEVTNLGPKATSNVDVVLRGTGSVQIGDGEARAYVGDMEPNETRTLAVEATVGMSVTAGEKPLEGVVDYEGPNGLEAESVAVTGHLPVSESQSFAVESVSDTLRVGFDGVISGEIKNEGPKPIEDAVLVIEPQTDSLYVEDTRYALETLDAGEAAPFEFPTDVSGDADAGPRQVTFRVEYQENDVTRHSSTLSSRIKIDPYRDAFAVDGVETNLTMGEASTVRLQVTNQRNVTLQNIDALAYTDSPLEAPGDAAFIDELAPGESAAVTVEIEATSDARATTYPVELDFEYETPDGSTEVSDTFQVPLDVAEPETEEGIDTMNLLIGGVIVVALIAGAILWWRS